MLDFLRFCLEERLHAAAEWVGRDPLRATYVGLVVVALSIAGWCAVLVYDAARQG